jgi:hypothetical protein
MKHWTEPDEFARVVNNNWSKLHLIDRGKYKRVSKSKTLCGLTGKQVRQPMAAWFGGAPWCEICKKKATKLHKVYKAIKEESDKTNINCTKDDDDYYDKW